MGSSRQEYAALLATLEPREAVNVLDDRVELITTINRDIADWLLERRKVEQAYAQGLQRLARKHLRDGGASLGIFQLPWQRIVESTESLAQSHEGLAQKIEVDAETPLRQFVSKNREMQAISTIQGNLAAIAKELDNAQKKADRLKDRSGRHASTRTATANSSIEDAQQQWETQSPYVFEQLQLLDETRVNNLRDVLTQFQTHEVDSIEQNRKPAERCLNALLNIETVDEIKAFATRINTEPRQTPMPRRQSSASNTMRRLSSAGGSIVPPLPPPPRLTSDKPRQAPSLGFGNAQGESSANAKETPKKIGLKSRLGTVMGRRKNATSTLPSTEKSKKERNRTSFMPFRRGDSSRSQPDIEEASGRGLTPVTSPQEGWGASPSAPNTEADRLSSLPTESEGRQRTPVDSTAINGTSYPESQHEITASTSQISPTNDISTAPAQPLHELSVTPPSPIMHMDVISRAQQEALASNAENEEAVRRLKIRDQPIQEDEAEAQQAMEKIKNQLRLQAQSTGVNRLGGSVRGRRDVRNTVFIPNPEPPIPDDELLTTTSTAVTAPSIGGVAGAAGMTSTSDAELTSPSPTKAPAALPEERTMSDTTSVHSAQSLGTIVHHPEMHEPGLNASMIETVSTWFSNGTVSKSVVVGEVALAYKSGELTSESEKIRLDNFQVLEKIAPNPSFVSSADAEKAKEEEPSSEVRAGEYIVNLAPITRSTPTVAFKYQLDLDPSNLSVYSPVLITPAWQIQDAQASVMVVYALNPAFVLSSSETQTSTPSLTLRNLVLSIALDPSPDTGKATSAMMAPANGAVFRRKQGVVVWKLGELTVSNEQQKLLARFVTSGPKARPGPVDAKWELAGTMGSRLGVSVRSSGAGKGKEAAADPFADADDGTAAPISPVRGWKEVHTARSLVSGRYSASP